MERPDSRNTCFINYCCNSGLALFRFIESGKVLVSFFSSASFDDYFLVWHSFSYEMASYCSRSFIGETTGYCVSSFVEGLDLTSCSNIFSSMLVLLVLNMGVSESSKTIAFISRSWVSRTDLRALSLTTSNDFRICFFLLSNESMSWLLVPLEACDVKSFLRFF